MGQYFWTYETDLPPDIGLSLFSTTHLIMSSAILILIVAAVLIYRRLSLPARRWMQLALGVLMVAGYPARWIWLTASGHFPIEEILPLHLCGMSAWLEFATLWYGKPVMKEFAYACAIPGALSTLVTPGMGPYPIFHFYFLQFLLTHSILILLPVIWVWGDGFRPNFRRLPYCLSILLAMAGGVSLVNRFLGSNFMFLNYAPESTPLKPLADFFGNPGYQFAMGGLLLLIWIVAYTPWIFTARAKAKKSAAH